MIQFIYIQITFLLYREVIDLCKQSSVHLTAQVKLTWVLTTGPAAGGFPAGCTDFGGADISIGGCEVGGACC